MSFINWIKTHKLAVLLILIVAFLLFKDSFSRVRPLGGSYTGYSMSSAPMIAKSTRGIPGIGMPSQRENIVQLDNRMVIKNSDLSLLVTDVRAVSDQILSYAKGVGGFMVSPSYTKPEESPFATVIIRVPTTVLENALSHLRSLGVKVISENLMGTDVTGEYTDIEARLTTLKKTQAKFNDILEKVTNVADILSVQRELISLQDQIDSLIGQKTALVKNAELTKITVYLSTDELALPYTPDKAFRPNLIFKEAVRSLINSVRQAAEILIWIGVYSVFWIPLVLGYLGYKRFRQNK